MADDIAQTGQSILNVFGLKSTLNDFGGKNEMSSSCAIILWIVSQICLWFLLQKRAQKWNLNTPMWNVTPPQKK